jgi:polysaccharide export outer membrane protein
MKINVLGFLVVMLMWSCSSKKEILYFQDADKYVDTSIKYSGSTLQPNDILKITVGALVPEAAIPYNKISSNSLQSSNIEIMKLDGYIVSSEQTITFPVLGIISVDNKTTEQLEQDLKHQLESGGHLTNPSVSVRLLNAKVTILGEVNQPGTYNFTEQNITLLQALGYANDLTINGKRNDILLLREVDGNRKITHIDLTTASWLDNPFYFIKPNDVIVVNPNDSKVKSAGFVGNSATVLTIASLVLSSIILLTR